MPLHRYWFEMGVDEERSGSEWPYSYGVTAYSEDDARGLLSMKVFREQSLPMIRRVTKDVDISTLDENHVRPNMGNPLKRGIWFPLGLDR
jgi:hypothetical protein